MPVPRIALTDDGPDLSRIVHGVWRLLEWDRSAGELLGLIHHALDLGITTFDHADIYGDYEVEEAFGEALAREPALRERLELVTKCGIKLLSGNRPHHGVKHYDTSRAHIIDSAERSLKNLRTDRLDLLLIHRPDPLMDADEIAGAFVALREAGKVRHFGVSNFTPSQVALLRSRLPFPLATNQVECSVLHLDPLHDGTLDQCQRLGIAPMAWSPLGGGRLFTSNDPQARRLRQALTEVGEEHGDADLDQVALAWLLRHPARIVPVLGTGREDRLAAAAAAAGIALNREQWFTIWTASTGTSVP